MNALRLLLLAAVLFASTGAEPTQSTDIIRSDVCPSGASVNIMGSIPRRDRSFTDVSGNWGSYSGWFDCTGPSHDRTCEAAEIDSDEISSGDAFISPYFEGVMLYLALGIFMCFSSVVYLTCFIFWRYCCCCCCRKSRRCKCGGKYPLPREGSCFSLGYQILGSGVAVVPKPVPVAPVPAPAALTENGEVVKPLGDGTEGMPDAAPAPVVAQVPAAAAGPSGEFGYTKCGRICSLSYLIIFLLSVCLFIGLGELNGNRALIPAAKHLADSPTDLMNLAKESVNPIGNLVQSFASDTLFTFLDDLNTTITNSTDLPLLIENLDCVLLEVDRFPEVDTLIALVDDLKDGSTSLDTSLETLQGDLRHTDAVLDDLTSQANNIKDEIVPGFEGQLANLTAATTQLNNTLDSIEEIIDEFANTATGHAYVVRRDMQAIQNDWPTPADTAVVSDLIDEALAGDMTGGGTDASPQELKREAFIAATANLAGVFQTTMPNFTKVALNAEAFNNAADNTRDGALQSVFDDLERAETALNSIYSSAVLNATFRAVLNGTASLGLGRLNTTLKEVDGLITNLIDFDSVRVVLNNVKRVKAVLPCMDRVADELLTLNVTIVSLPDDISEVVNLSNELNETLAPTLEQIDSTLVDLNATEAKIDAVDIPAYIRDVTNSQAQADSAIANINIDKLDANLVDLDTQRVVDFDSISADVREFNRSLATARVPQFLIDSIRDWEVTRVALYTKLGVASADMATMNGGYCTFDNSTYCKTDSDCAGLSNFCVERGEVRCAIHQHFKCTVSDDSACKALSTSERCLLDGDLLGNIDIQLTSSDGNRTVFGTGAAAAEASMDIVINDASFDLGDLRSDLEGSIDAASAVDTAGLLTGANSLLNAVASVDIPTYNTAVQDARDKIGALDLSSIRTKLKDLNVTITDFKGDKRDQIVDAINGTKAMRDLLFDRLHLYLADLDVSNLQARRDAEGLSGMVRAIANIADDASNFISNRTTLVDERLTLNKDLEDDDIYRILDVLSLADYSSQGSLYFFGKLLMDDDVLDADDPVADRVFKDINDEDYPDDKLCLTKVCIDKSIDQAASDPMSEYSSIPSPFTAQDTISLLWIFPAIVVLFGLWSLCCFACCCKKRENGASWQKVPVSWMTGIIFCQMPVLFLIMALVFPLFIFVSDSCTGYPNVMLQYVDGMSDTLCVSEDYFRGQGTLEACSLDQKIRDERRLNFTINIREAFIGLVSECPETDPFLTIWDSIETEAAPLPLDAVNDFLDEMEEGDSDLKLRPPIQNIIRKAAASLDPHMVTLARELSTAIDCEGLNAAISSVNESTCCETLDAFYWLVSAWYLIVWSYCLCGCCSGVLARKRLGVTPWGDAYKENIFVTPNAALANEQYAPFSPGGLIPAEDMQRFGGGGGGVVSPQDMAGMVDGPQDPNYGGAISLSQAGQVNPNPSKFLDDDLDTPTGRYADV